MSKTKKKRSKKKYLAKKNKKYKELLSVRRVGLDEEDIWDDGERYRLITTRCLANKVHEKHYVRNWLDVNRGEKYNRMISTMSDVQRKQWIPQYAKNWEYCRTSDRLKYCEQVVDIGDNQVFEKPCFILLSGPSLEKNVHELERIKNREDICVIAASGAIQLYKEPDYYIVVDYYGDKGWLKGVDTSKVTGVFSYFTANHIVKHDWKRRVMFNTFLKNELSNKVEQEHPHLMKMEQGMHTGYSAFFLSFILGCSPIIFVGADYSWKDDKKMHSVDNEEKWTEEIEEGSSFPVGGIDGTQWRSRMDYVKFMLHIRAGAYFLANEGYEESGKMNTQIINATEGGILSYPPYIGQARLADIVDKINENPIERKQNG